MRGGRRRRRASLNRTIPLSRLLERQPGPLGRHSRYGEMTGHFNLSPALKNLRISRRCYSLLNRAVIEPENLSHFYRTYRVPKDPFFPLFLMIKRDYLKEKEQKAQEKEAFILTEVKKLPPVRRKTLRFLAEWENCLNWKSEHPLWERVLYPRTKKRVRELLHFGDPEWADAVRFYLDALKNRYPGMKPGQERIIAACLNLHLFPSLPGLKTPGAEEINKAYKKLCLIHHPDAGGSDNWFIVLGESRMFLLSLQ